MLKIRLFLIILFLMFPLTSGSKIYSVYVTKVTDNLYKTNNNVYILTRYCYEFSYGENAILKYDGYSGKLIFDNSNTSCDVIKLLVEAK